MNGLQDTVLSGSLLLAAVVAVTAGVVSFFSPCSLPLVPGYLSYVAGVSGQESTVVRELQGHAPTARGRTIAGAGLFVLGFAAVFTSYGALFGALGSQLVRHQEDIIRFSGALTVLEPGNDVGWANEALPLLGAGPVVPLWVSLAVADWMVKLSLAILALVPFRMIVSKALSSRAIA